jgi:hypothetical protein
MTFFDQYLTFCLFTSVISISAQLLQLEEKQTTKTTALQTDILDPLSDHVALNQSSPSNKWSKRRQSSKTTTQGDLGSGCRI